MVKDLVSIITVNYKQPEVTNQLLDSLQKVTWPNVEIIVVDNNSGEKLVRKLKTYPNVKIVLNDKNLGFAGANNVGIGVSKGEYILLLNNDTEVVPSFLEPMVGLLKSDKTIGAISPKIKYFHSPEILQYAGFTPMNPFTLRMKAIGWGKREDKMELKVSETNFAHGCAMLVPRRVIDRVGLMPEKYFLYYEEHEWSFRMKQAGFRIYFQPGSLVLHKESVSVKKNSELKTYYLNRNRILFMRRNLGVFQQVLSVIYLVVISVPKNILSFLAKRQYGHLRAYTSALVWNLKN